MAIKKKDILGYLNVLGCRKVLDQLSSDDLLIANRSVMGCYPKLLDSLEKANNPIYRLIRHRESLNVKFPIEHPELAAATEETALRLLQYLKGDYISPEIKKEFVDKLDKEFARILESKCVS